MDRELVNWFCKTKKLARYTSPFDFILFLVGSGNYFAHNHRKINSQKFIYLPFLFAAGITPVLARKILSLVIYRKYRHTSGWIILFLWFTSG